MAHFQETQLHYCIFAVLAAIVNQVTGALITSNLTITTSPSGPVYPAATWIRVACRLEHSQPQILQYKWTASCYSTGDIVYDIAEPFLDEESSAVIWLKSTPVECLDHFLCTVYERNGETLTEIGSKNFTQQVSGVGVSLPDTIFLGFVPNNSVVIFDSESNNKQELFCHSALQSSCTGEWLGLTPPPSESCEEDEASGSSMSYKSVKLDLKTVSQEGMHVCAIHDEALQEQRSYIGVYQSVPELQVESSYKVSEDNLLLECNAQGPPSTATLWNKDGILLSNSEDQLMASSSLLLGDQRQAHYRHSLSLTDPTVFGVLSCDVHSDWVTADKRNSGRKSATAFFVVLPLSEQIQLECAFPQGITNVEWLNNSANFEILPPERNNTAIISLVVNEDTHGNNFRCRGLDQSGQAVYKQYRIIARVPNEALTVKVAPPTTMPVAGQPLELTCCASTTAEALTLQPSLHWHKDGQVLSQGEHVDLWTSSEGEEKCLTAFFASLARENVGGYVCRGALQSTGTEDILVREMEFQLTANFSDYDTDEDDNDEEFDNEDSNAVLSMSASQTKVTDTHSDLSNNHQLVTVITSVVFSLVVLVLLLTVAVILLAVCTRRVHKHKNTDSSTVEIDTCVKVDTHLDEPDSKM